VIELVIERSQALFFCRNKQTNNKQHMEKIKESQRRAIWKALRCLEAAESIGLLVVNGHKELACEQKNWESKAHNFYREAGFDDLPTFDLHRICAQICRAYENGQIQVVLFE